MTAGLTGLRRFERCLIMVGNAAVIMVHTGAAGMVMLVFVLLLVGVVVSIAHQLVTMHMKMIAARMRVEDEPRAWHGNARDKEQNHRRRETADPNAPPLHDRWPLPHPGRNSHVVHAVLDV